MKKKISRKDKIDWENFLLSDQALPDKDYSYLKEDSKKIISIDLHGYSLDEANTLIEEFIKKAYEKKVRKIIVITGKGIHSDNLNNPYKSKDLGILKYSVPEYIKTNLELMKIINNIEEANIKDGESGSFYIFLKKNNK